MGTMASQITSHTSVYSTAYLGADQGKHQSSVSLAFVRWPVNSSHKGLVTRKLFPFDVVIMVLTESFGLILKDFEYLICFNIFVDHMTSFKMAHKIMLYFATIVSVHEQQK